MDTQNIIQAIDARNYRITQHADEEPIHSVWAYVETNQRRSCYCLPSGPPVRWTNWRERRT